MAKANKVQPKWLIDVEEHDYPAASDYLHLTYDTTLVARMVNNLRAASIVYFKAKDIFRASGLSLLGVSNSHVSKNLAKISKGRAMSPLLLVRDVHLGKVVVADGYHRMCAAYTFNEDTLVPCKIA